MSADSIVGYEVLDDRRVGEGGFLTIRRLRVRLVRGDGSRSQEGLYDFVERPVGLDAVVLALYHRPPRRDGDRVRDGGGGRVRDGDSGDVGRVRDAGSGDGVSVRVLLRDGLRVPLHFGRAAPPGPPRLFTELVAGILEAGENTEEGISRRAVEEAHEEAGVAIDPAGVVRLGPPVFPTAGMCAEQFHLLAAEVSDVALAAMSAPGGDGSPFEEGARVRWAWLDDALAECARGAISDLKTEVTLRRLADYLASK